MRHLGSVGLNINDVGDDLGEEGLWLDGDEVARLGQRGDHSPVLSVAVRAGEHPILSIQGHRPDSHTSPRATDTGPSCLF